MSISSPSVTLASSVRISDDVRFQELQGEAVLLDLKSATYFGLDQVGTRIWQLIPMHNRLVDVASVMAPAASRMPV